MSALFGRIAARIEREGPIRFADHVALALYDPDDGFYSAGGRAGRRGDFITSPEVGPLFGAVLGRALDTWWDELGRPDPFVVTEAGAGVGTLARAVLEGAPRCLEAMTYLLVEQSAALRARHGDHLPMTDPQQALVPASRDEDGAEPADPPGGTGPRFVSLGELPATAVRGVVVANELLDNLPFDLFERTAEGWAEVRVALDPADGQALVEVLVALPDDDARLVGIQRILGESGANDPSPGARVPVQRSAADWVLAARSCLEQGRVVVIDYADTTVSMAARPFHEWLRTYRDQDRGIHPLDAPGSQDITAEVAVDQLALVGAPDGDVDQASFLRAHGIDELVEEGRRTWDERAHLGDLTALKARSRVNESVALLDPGGLGSFRVLTWIVDR